MKDDHVVTFLHPGGCHLRMFAYPPAKVQDGPSSPVSVNKKRTSHLPSCCVLCVFSKESYTLGHKDRVLVDIVTEALKKYNVYSLTIHLTSFTVCVNGLHGLNIFKTTLCDWNS